MKSVKSQLGTRIRKLRKMRNLTQEQLAEFLGIDQKQVSCIERGINAPAMERLQSISEALGVQLRDLFDFDDKQGSIDESLLKLGEGQRKIAYKIFQAAIEALHNESNSRS